ncbi:P-II family nitrogen regulator [Aureliella helgolandensis]|uniref:Nitrogen regulatory protein P-II 2 n=1 Tax=Aureliella helgolandensis TaxID=2527968 RepID=A0A518G4H6_9BACT|nr:P-II family nitrogen regulator [Aureliella helgolandensis]QDV23503.1 Nitrogen regulatory protein P-II 2 [Aureliella helgolandensis]
MKQVIAVVRPYLAERVLENLRMAPLEALMVREVKGYGRQKNYLQNYNDSEYGQAFLPKVEITMWVEDFRVEEVIQRVNDVARSGRMGDGKILVLPLTGFADASSPLREFEA